MDAREGKKKPGGQPGNHNATKPKNESKRIEEGQNEYFESKTNQTNDV